MAGQVKRPLDVYRFLRQKEREKMGWVREEGRGESKCVCVCVPLVIEVGMGEYVANGKCSHFQIQRGREKVEVEDES